MARILNNEGISWEESNIKTESFLDKDKLILIFYINVGNLSGDVAGRYFISLQEKIKSDFDNSIKPIFLAVRNQETKVEAFSIEGVDTIHLDEISKKIEESLNEIKSKK